MEQKKEEPLSPYLLIQGSETKIDYSIIANAVYCQNRSVHELWNQDCQRLLCSRKCPLGFLTTI